MARKKKLGVGAKCAVLTKYLHPSIAVNEKYPNATASARTSDLKCIRKEKKIVNRSEQEVAIFRHDDFDIDLHAVLRWVKVVVEGDKDGLFGGGEEDETPVAVPFVDQVTPGERIPENIFESSGTAEDIAMVIGQGFQVDDDNAPAEENIPRPATEQQANENDYVEAEWKWDGICSRKMNSCPDMKPQIRECPI